MSQGLSAGRGIGVLFIGAFAVASVAIAAMTRSDPATPEEPPPRPPAASHASGATTEDLETFRWVGSVGDALRESLNGACGMAVIDCAYGPPDARSTCLPPVLAACEAAVASAEATPLPDAVSEGFRGFIAERREQLCTYSATRDALQADASLAARIRNVRGEWEGTESTIGRDAAEGRPGYAEWNHRLQQCLGTEPRAGLERVAGWLRSRFTCGIPHPSAPAVTIPRACTVERAGELVREHVEPGPPEAM